MEPMQPTRSQLNSLAAKILRDASPEDAVVLAWPLVCGSAVAARSRALGFYDNVLWVQVPDKGWQAQLADFGPQYSDRLSKITGQKVQSVCFEVGKFARS